MEILYLLKKMQIINATKICRHAFGVTWHDIIVPNKTAFNNSRKNLYRNQNIQGKQESESRPHNAANPMDLITDLIYYVLEP